MYRVLPRKTSILATSLAAGLFAVGAAHAGTQLVANSSGLTYIDQDTFRVLAPTTAVKTSDGRSWYTAGLAKSADGSYWLVGYASSSPYEKRVLHLAAGATSWDNVAGLDTGDYLEDIAISDQGRVFVSTACRSNAAKVLELVGTTLTSKLDINDCAAYYHLGLRTGAAVTAPTGSFLTAADTKLYVAYLLNDYVTGRVASIDLATGDDATVLESDELSYTSFDSIQSVAAGGVDFTEYGYFYHLNLDGTTVYKGYAAYRGLFGANTTSVYGLAAVPGAGCIPTTTAACLLERFRVSVKFAGTKNAQQVPTNRFLAGFTYGPVDTEDFQVYVKVLDKCSTPAKRFQVFATGFGSATQPASITILDTKNGKQVVLAKAAGNFAALKDTTTFTCP
jgi:hypothetical protein